MNQPENESENVLQTLFAEAFEIKDKRERAAFLSGACGIDSALRQEVDDLLQAAEAVGCFLPDKPVSTGAGSALREFASTLGSDDVIEVAPLAEQPGDCIGRYRLLEKIGEGGCGVVYMAEQEQPVRRCVALKVIKLGMDTKSVIGRFEAERQALAVIDHPNIAKVFDAGATQTGRPFFVMELVRGTRITDYCRQQELSIRQRLELFIQVCQAVQHAHQKGIIHRDLKPSNILVSVNDSVAVPKVIDFGIAKATEGRLTDQTLFTAFEQFLGTPAYMSPEQAAMTSQDIDTRSDIYSLGVLLYELLTGSTPFDTKEVLALGVDELRRTIREKDPVRPSTALKRLSESKVGKHGPDGTKDALALNSQLKSLSTDLDWIVMKCLEKDRARRYETANGLAADLRRHLNNEPVVARPPSHIYEFQKTIQRHRVGFAAGLAVITTLAVGVLISTREAVRARRAEHRQAELQRQAEHEATRAREAEADMKEKLWRAYLAETQSGRWSRRPGRRLNGLELLKSAAEIRPSLELRNEAIACMALADLRVIKEWQAHPIGGHSVAFDAQYERYAYVDASNTVHVCRVGDAMELSQFSGFEPPMMGMKFSPDGRLLVVVFGKRFERVQVLDLNSKTVVFYDAGPPGRNMEFSADSRLLAVACEEPKNICPVRIFDLSLRREIGSFHHGSLPFDLRFHPTDINRLLITDSSQIVRIWDWPTGKVVQRLIHPNWVLRAAWHPDGEIVATGCADHKVHLWEAATGREVAVLTGHEAVPVNISFSADGEFLATRGWEGILRLWDYKAQRELISKPVLGDMYSFGRAANHFGLVSRPGKFAVGEASAGTGYRLLPTSLPPSEDGVSCDFSPDGQLLVSTDPNGFHLWDVQTGQQLASVSKPRWDYFAAFHPVTSNLIVGTANGLEDWSVARDAPERKGILEFQRKWDRSFATDRIYLSRDRRTLATGSATERALHVFDVESGREIQQLKPRYGLFLAALSADARLAATWIRNATNLHVWDFARSNIVHELPTYSSTFAAFSPNNQWLVVGNEVEFRAWDTRTWQSLYALPREASGSYGYMAFTADSRVLALAISRSLVRLVEAGTGRELATLEAPDRLNIHWLTFNADGTRLAAASGLGAIQLWDLGLIREQLAAMKLDWDLPSGPASSQEQAR